MLGRRRAAVWSMVAAGALLASAPLAYTTIHQSYKDKGATRVTWNSSFVDLSYDCLPITLTETDVNVGVDWGDAAFLGFVGRTRTFTPKKDVTGSYVASESSYVVTLTGLHYDKKRDVWIGNVHLKVLAEVDKDGQPGREAVAKLGVNLHLESASDC